MRTQPTSTDSKWVWIDEQVMMIIMKNQQTFYQKEQLRRKMQGIGKTCKKKEELNILRDTRFLKQTNNAIPDEKNHKKSFWELKM